MSESLSHTDRVTRSWLHFCVVNMGFSAVVDLLLELQVAIVTDSAHPDQKGRRVEMARNLLRGALILAQNGTALAMRAQILLEDVP
jgi:hypothetical protein